MKLISVYTDSHRIFKDQWFLPSLQDHFEKEMFYYADTPGGAYLDATWSHAIVFKVQTIISEIKKNWGNILIYSDVDIQFFAPLTPYITKRINDKDILCQRDDPTNQFCAGFVIMHCNTATLKLYEQTLAACKLEGREQIAFNRMIRCLKIKCGYLPQSFFGGGTFSGKIWTPGMPLSVPPNPVMHHANFTIGTQNKIAQLEYVRDIVSARKAGKFNLLNRLHSAMKMAVSAAAPKRQEK